MFGAGPLAFLLIYAYIRRVRYPVLFVSAVFGLEVLVTTCLMGMALPIYILVVFVFPKFVTISFDSSLISYLFLGSIMSWYVISAIVIIAGTLLLYRAYPGVFKNEARI